MPEEMEHSKHAGNLFSMVLQGYSIRLQRLFTASVELWKSTIDRLQSAPLAYKLSFIITLLIVSCMVLLGSLLIQQQSEQVQQQISEQGTTLAHLMANAAREPLLAEDQLALDRKSVV